MGSPKISTHWYSFGWVLLLRGPGTNAVGRGGGEGYMDFPDGGGGIKAGGG
jgi:hypothetical protein